MYALMSVALNNAYESNALFVEMLVAIVIYLLDNAIPLRT
jgi:hypothetical protein